MARVPSKHSRDQAQDFEGLLNNLQDWELSFKDKDKKLRSDDVSKGKLVTSPTALPGIFKNALSASILVDIIRCIATFFTEDMALGVEYLQNLAKIPRFDMIIMCLSPTDKAGMSTANSDTVNGLIHALTDAGFARS
ncbi:UNVERIFIED_CONTAM: hypothetical protein Sradi_4755300 [Sesamum radiatum]|uniref:RNA-polymerase II-associated protein 3-like C-terminal domain-containing protein n=1 Tax=Sesamum radiatum TaxID=300843 RepID=A0AAW2MVR8_SESRA